MRYACRVVNLSFPSARRRAAGLARDGVRWQTAWGPVGRARLEDDGKTLITEVRIDRRPLVNSLFYGIENMRIGGTRRLAIAPHMAYGDTGVPGVVPLPQC